MESRVMTTNSAAVNPHHIQETGSNDREEIRSSPGKHPVTPIVENSNRILGGRQSERVGIGNFYETPMDSEQNTSMKKT